MSTRNGNWFLTFTGRKFYPLDPRPEDVCINDIAHHLSLVCRFNGAVREFLSVAQHSLLVESIHPGLQALLHDAPEFALSDLIRPVKHQMPEYRAIEQRLWLCICEAFGINPVMPPELKRADNIALMTERRDLLIASEHDFQIAEKPLAKNIFPLTPHEAEEAFLKRFKELT